MNVQPTQRLRLSFSRGEEVKFLSHLDLVRFWERAVRRAELPLAYSQGFNPRPRLTLAAPLAVGFMAMAELMDVVLDRALSIEEFTQRLETQLPPGIKLNAVTEVESTLPSLPSQVRAAEYVVRVKKDDGERPVHERIQALLEAASLPRQRVRDTKTVNYDLRPLVEELTVLAEDQETVELYMRLCSNASGAGRPDEVVRQLDLPAPTSICRVSLIL